MSILKRFRTSSGRRDRRALERALDHAPTQASRHELEVLRSLGR